MAFKVDYNCAKCGVDTLEIEEYYMLEQSVWNIVAWHMTDKMLCIGCFESMFGRKLCSNDFSDALVNTWHKFPKSERLRDRLNRYESGG